MNRNAIILLILIILGVFSNTLFNDFVGDDHVLFVYNDFYKSWDNIGGLFSNDYIAEDSKIYTYHQQQFHSGSVAYRPVLSMTYFLDYWIWKSRFFSK